MEQHDEPAHVKTTFQGPFQSRTSYMRPKPKGIHSSNGTVIKKQPNSTWQNKLS